jgi:amino acid transporter
MEQVKTLLLGMLIAVVLMMLMGAGATSSRYQIAGAGGTSYYILDSHTGKVVAAGGEGAPGRTEGASIAVQGEKRF